VNPQASQKQARIIIGVVCIGGGSLFLLFGVMRLQSMESKLVRAFGGSDGPGAFLVGFGGFLFLGGIVLLILSLMASPSTFADPLPAHPLHPPIALPPRSPNVNRIYHYNTINGLSGPFTLDEMRVLFAAGRLSPATYIHRVGDSKWRLMAAFPELAIDRNG
jgi:hypothetical protein